MTMSVSRRPVMTLFTGPDCIFSHSCRFVIVEKEVECQVIDVGAEDVVEELAELNPYNETPTLVDRGLVLYGAQVINEYLEERLPHPPLMPIDPVSRARARLMIMRFEREWIAPYSQAQAKDTVLSEERTRDIRDGLIALSPMFSQQAYMLGEEFSLVDCVAAPLFWRLRELDIELPFQARAVTEYADRLFSRPAFQSSLTKVERSMRAE